ncbi:MAG: O-antigen ligase family protein [Hyellaceae cyanobacterium CSU_1_1]|nr:O-antigen ligase family protein [Hyellaceae cyanobacterium CSU_1_1]
MTGVYGIIQFLVAPAWDQFYLNQNDLLFLGKPTPLGIRVFSTMGQSVTFGANLMPGLLLLLISKEKWRFTAAGCGYLVFLLSQARTPWYTFILAVLFFVFSLKGSHQIRAIITVTLVALLIIPLTTIEPFSEKIIARIETFDNLENDGSYQTRTKQFENSINYALSQSIGYGLISPGQAPTQENAASKKNLFSVNDNGYLALFVSLGWFGTIIYLVGLISLFLKVFQVSIHFNDTFLVCARAIALASLLRLFTANVTTGPYAMPIWGFLGIAIAGYKYYLTQYISANRGS